MTVNVRTDSRAALPGRVAPVTLHRSRAAGG